jgi:alanine dehydrogenase
MTVGTLVLHESDVGDLIDMDLVIDAVERAMRDLGENRADNAPRSRVGDQTTLLNVMSATWPGGGVSGLKTYVISEGEAWYAVLVFDGQGLPVGLFEAESISRFRTGAASAVAARALTTSGPKSVGLIGTGDQAYGQVSALRRTVNVAELRVYGRDRSRLIRFVHEVDASAVESAEAAVRGADIVVTATTSVRPVLDATWVKPGALVIAIGSNMSNRAELPADLISSAAVVVDQLATALLESGDLIQAGYDFAQAVELGAVLAGRAHVKAGDQTVVFESHGLALWDIAAASVVLESARQRQLGNVVQLLSSRHTLSGDIRQRIASGGANAEAQ